MAGLDGWSDEDRKLLDDMLEEVQTYSEDFKTWSIQSRRDTWMPEEEP